MSNEPQLHSSITALVSLASGIAAKHPDMGLCQLDKLRGMGIPESQINTVIEIARHIRDEAALKLDSVFNEKAGIVKQKSDCCSDDTDNKTESTVHTDSSEKVAIADAANESCCSSTPKGQSCC